MNCTEARQHWMLYLDSEGDPELHLHIRDHLGVCPACAAWFAQQHQLDRRINASLAAGTPTPDLWSRILSRSGLRPRPAWRGRWPVVIGGIAAAVLLTLGLSLWMQSRARSLSVELARSAVEWHEQWQRGNVRPDFVSGSDEDVDRYLKAKVPFRVHCPPRSDVNFLVQGAGVCFMKDLRQAAYIMGRVGNAPVSILVLDRASVAGFPRSGVQHCKEGTYRVTSGVIADNVVVVIGTTTPDVLEHLLNAYGSYPEG